MTSLNNKIAIVLGGSQGLGFSVAKSLAKKEVKVFIISRDESKLKNACSQLNAISNMEHSYFVCDQSKKEDVDKLLLTIKNFKQIDSLILNSGGPKFGQFKDLTIQDWQDSTNMILNSFIKTLQVCIPIMQKTGGTIAAITSISASRPIKGLTLSNVIRPAVEGLIRTIAEEYAEDNINAVAIEPGKIFTDRIKSIVENSCKKSGKTYEEELSASANLIPLKKFGDPDKFGDFVSFFTTESGRYVTGQTLIYDGGIQLR